MGTEETLAAVNDPLYTSQRDLTPHEAYYLRCYYGEKAKPPRRVGDLAIEVRLTSKSALMFEIAASRAREAKGEIGEITVHIAVQPRYRSLYR